MGRQDDEVRQEALHLFYQARMLLRNPSNLSNPSSLSAADDRHVNPGPREGRNPLVRGRKSRSAPGAGGTLQGSRSDSEQSRRSSQSAARRPSSGSLQGSSR